MYTNSVSYNKILYLKIQYISFLFIPRVSQSTYKNYINVDCSNRTHYRSFGRLRGIHKMRYIEFFNFQTYF